MGSGVPDANTKQHVADLQRQSIRSRGKIFIDPVECVHQSARMRRPLAVVVGSVRRHPCGLFAVPVISHQRWHRSPLRCAGHHWLQQRCWSLCGLPTLIMDSSCARKKRWQIHCAPSGCADPAVYQKSLLRVMENPLPPGRGIEAASSLPA